MVATIYNEKSGIVERDIMLMKHWNFVAFITKLWNSVEFYMFIKSL